MIHPTKSTFIFTSLIEYFGFVVIIYNILDYDSVEMTVRFAL